MAASDVFRKLTANVKFNLKRFHEDAVKLKLVSVDTPAAQTKTASEIVKQFLDASLDQKSKSAPVATNPGTKRPSVTSPNTDKRKAKRVKRVHFADEEVVDAKKLPSGEVQLIKTSESSFPTQKTSKNLTQSEEAKLKHAAKMKRQQVVVLRKQHSINALGTDIPEPATEFSQLSDRFAVSDGLLQNIKMSGYNTPTPIQMQAITAMLENRNVLCCAPTGSGKTAAFLIPIIHQLKKPQKKGFRAVIVEPTRELAKQTLRECLRLCKDTNLRAFVIDKAERAIKKFGPESSKRYDILVTTPNRLVFLLKQDPPLLSLKNVQWLVVDESDKLFEAGRQGFRDQLSIIYTACSSASVRRAMFSATFDHDVNEWCKLNLDNVISITIGLKNTTVMSVKQRLVFVGNEGGKLVEFRNIIQAGLKPPVLVFVQTKERAQELFNELIYDGINVDVIHADRTQLQRDNIVKAYRLGQIWVLICTELMGRGIDFVGVNLVVNYDFPPSEISYIHRIGRTGRAGREGEAITFFTERDKVNLRCIASVMKQSGCSVPDFMLKIRKPDRKMKKFLKQNAPKRKRISTLPLPDYLRRKQLLKSSLKVHAHKEGKSPKATKYAKVGGQKRKLVSEQKPKKELNKKIG